MSKRPSVLTCLPLVFFALAAWGESSIESDVYASAHWEGSLVSITPTEDYEAYLTVRVVHGSDEFWMESGPHLLWFDTTSFVGTAWPDLSWKGDLASAPAVVNAVVRLYGAEGEQVSAISLEPMLWWGESPEITVPQEDLALWVNIPLDDDLALATASPQAIVSAGEVAP